MSAAAATRSFSKSIAKLREPRATRMSVAHRNLRKKDLALRIKIYCAIELILGILFFVWAVVHVILGFIDIGIIAWPAAIIAGLFGLIAVNYYEKQMEDKAASMGKLHCILIIVAHILLVIAFAAAAIADPQHSFGSEVFFTMMALLYVVTGMIFGRWSYIWYHLFVKQTEYGLLSDGTDENNDNDGDSNQQL